MSIGLQVEPTLCVTGGPQQNSKIRVQIYTNGKHHTIWGIHLIGTWIYRNTYINSMSYWYIIGFTPSGPQQKLAVKTPLRLARIEGTDFAQHSGHQHSHWHSDAKKRCCRMTGWGHSDQQFLMIEIAYIYIYIYSFNPPVLVKIASFQG